MTKKKNKISKLDKKYLKSISPAILSKALADFGAIDDFVDYAEDSSYEDRPYLLSILEAFEKWGADKFDQLILLSCYELACRDMNGDMIDYDDEEYQNGIIRAWCCLLEIVELGPDALQDWVKNWAPKC